MKKTVFYNLTSAREHYCNTRLQNKGDRIVLQGTMIPDSFFSAPFTLNETENEVTLTDASGYKIASWIRS